ncbi:hypothetical protein [Nitratidesulfovibrio liaohensis]|uniref:Uncharacterized protein n=1 Tax=Nitratidesulfovibrio liaohensis TaxID=2604158 RepID=A0ABY9R2S0_9BACT|nr:hypothetical protein [Nitratidesulfovibrio liaohensis]WMW66051.1 hypothetical protein KPS_000598 [Nitratidesulfovibrio liaohensis]
MTAPDTQASFSLSAVLSNLKVGLCVLRGELGRVASGVLRGMEARQLRRRMDDEYAALGRRVAELLEAGPLDAAGLADDARVRELTDDARVRELAGRAAFLRDELARHAAGAATDRERHLARMARCCGSNGPGGN